MQIDWWTLALQAVNFLVLVWLLQRFLYRPVLAVIARRKQLAEEAFAEADAAKAAAAEEKQRYEAGQEDLAAARRDLQKTMHAELEAERARIVEAAQRDAAELLETARADIARERSAAVAGVRAEITELAADMAQTVLGRVAASPDAGNAGALNQIEDELAKLPADEQARLRQDLAATGARLRVVTAAALPAGEQQRWRERLGAHLGPLDTVEFADDPALIGGAVLQFPHAALDFTWANLLRQAKDSLLRNETAH